MISVINIQKEFIEEAEPELDLLQNQIDVWDTISVKVETATLRIDAYF